MKKLLTGLLLIAFVLAGPIGCGSKITRDNYEKIKDGMTIDQVEDLLGKAGDKVSGGISIGGLEITGDKYEWKDGDRQIIVVFKDGKVVSKVASENL